MKNFEIVLVPLVMLIPLIYFKFDIKKYFALLHTFYNFVSLITAMTIATKN